MKALRFGLFGLLLLSSCSQAQSDPDTKDDVRIVYPKHTDLDFEGTDVDGELKRPAELYFQHRPSEKFDSLLKRRKEFHRAMLRDVMHE